MITARWARTGVAVSFLGVCAVACASDPAAPDEQASTGAGGEGTSAGGASSTGSAGMAGTPSGTGGESNGGASGNAASGGGMATGGHGGTAGSGGGAAKDAGPSMGDASTTPVRSTGCGKAAVAMAGSHATSIMVGAAMRTYDYDVPAAYSPDEAIPLVFGFHGAGGNGQQAFDFGINAAAAQAGQRAIFLFPNGVLQGNTIGWNEKKDGPDVALFDALLTWAKSTFCIDTNRVFVAGFSWGNDFSNTLGCYRGDKIRAINGFSGGLYNNDCGTVTPAYRATYSTPDGSDAYTQAEIDKAVNHYKTAQSCQNTSQAIAPSPCLAFQGCAKPVIFCGYPNMGHAVPPNGGKDAWAFFSTFQ